VLAKKFAALYYLLEDLLSPQKHYDWGLRAIKSVLVVAGSLLRAESGQDEADVLFRALRDFNIPKILLQVHIRPLDRKRSLASMLLEHCNVTCLALESWQRLVGSWSHIPRLEACVSTVIVTITSSHLAD
jgi:hypothetical protein